MSQIRKTLTLLSLSLVLGTWIFFYVNTPPLGKGDSISKRRLVATPFLSKFSTLPCLVLSKSPNPFQDKKELTPSEKTLSAKPLFRVRTAASFKSCGLQNLGVDELVWGNSSDSGDKQALLRAIEQSIRYLISSDATAAYQRYPVTGITKERVFRSLVRFRQLVLASRSAAELEAAVKREFVFYQSVGGDGLGNVLFTAYYEPVYMASRVPTPEYRYPIYRRPPNLDSWPKPHPTRKQLEGEDGLQGSKGRLRGLELFWLRSRMEAYLAQIQGSARLLLTDGKQTSVGFADNTAYNYTSIGRELVNDGKLSLEKSTLPNILRYFNKYPQELNKYLPRDKSFVFFKETHGGPAMGSINVPLTASRSIATDKSLMPPGALALIHAPIPFKNAKGEMEFRTVSRYVLDQDTGGAIKGPGRVDYFLGTGAVAGDRAGVTVADGQLYYLLLKQ
ncbi:MAG: murein transglycosylase A [Coleofasciculus sp. Co-bin14]|nr:murein transglycosylase A [Coleofasciculus sp. Co-bin14]